MKCHFPESDCGNGLKMLFWSPCQYKFFQISNQKQLCDVSDSSKKLGFVKKERKVLAKMYRDVSVVGAWSPDARHPDYSTQVRPSLRDLPIMNDHNSTSANVLTVSTWKNFWILTLTSRLSKKLPWKHLLDWSLGNFNRIFWTSTGPNRCKCVARWMRLLIWLRMYRSMLLMCVWMSWSCLALRSATRMSYTQDKSRLCATLFTNARHMERVTLPTIAPTHLFLIRRQVNIVEGIGCLRRNWQSIWSLAILGVFHWG